MTRVRYGIGTHPVIDDPAEPHWHSLPNLSTGRTLEHAIRALDTTARVRRRHYAKAWIAEVEDVGITLHAQCRTDGVWGLNIGCPCDTQSDERSRRLSALHAHLGSVDGAREEVIELQRSLGRYLDDREITTREIVGLLRPFVRTGGRVLISPDDCLEVRPDGNLMFDEPGREREAHWQTVSPVLALGKRWRSHGRIKRIVRRLGAPTINGWTILERRKLA